MVRIAHSYWQNALKAEMGENEEALSSRLRLVLLSRPVSINPLTAGSQPMLGDANKPFHRRPRI